MQEKTCKFTLTDQVLHLNHFDLNDKLSFWRINKWMREKLLPTVPRECRGTDCKLFEIGFQGHLHDFIFYISVLKNPFTSRLTGIRRHQTIIFFFSLFQISFSLWPRSGKASDSRHLPVTHSNKLKQAACLSIMIFLS